MRIRSITCFVNVGDPGSRGDEVRTAGRLAQEASTTLELAGSPVQTKRLATQPFSLLPGDLQDLASALWAECASAGFEYLSLGPVLADRAGADLSLIDLIPEIVRSSEAVFASVLAASRDGGLNLEAIHRTARIVGEIGRTTQLGFGNLRLAMLSNVEPHSPFFPAAYHDGGSPAIAIATEAADLAVAAFSDASSLEEARARLVASVEVVGGQLANLIQPLAHRAGYRFAGIDFSLAPFPEEARSIGAAVERLGASRFGASGTLFIAALLTQCLSQANYPRCGFNGLMLPVLEDAILAARSRERLFTINDLLLYSAVCGTGLDTVPLPGDVTDEELASILLDVATLAVRLNKPLTARLMPVPGARSGDITEFDFSYFANGRVLDVKGIGSPALFERGSWLAM